jgi:hypothetical protein
MGLLEARALPEGGFPARSGEPFRSDATAWAILPLLFFDPDHSLLGSARTRLAEAQAGDGSVSIAMDHADAYWPTALSVLAWNSSPLQESHRHRAVQFLLETTGKHWKKEPDGPILHDPSIPGWSWIAGTHSWVEPTALAVCALRSSGLAQHKRVSDGVRLLMDRQLPKGGWNYGNTKVFGTELHPDPESTGVALQALAGLVAYQDIRKSIDYLKAEVDHARTPIALGWGLLGLGAWGEAPKGSIGMIHQTLGRQQRYGPYDTSSLALLLLPLAAPGGILGASNAPLSLNVKG